MTGAAAAAVHEVRCHRCSKFVGESDVELEFIGVTNDRLLREAIAAPRVSYLCKCGWTSVFRKPLRN